MEFAKRMDRFGEGVFTMLAQMKHRRLEEGKEIVDLSIGAPNIPPAPHILKVLSEECLVPENYIYAINDQKELLNAVSRWYKNRYSVELDPETEIGCGRGRQGTGSGSLLSDICGRPVSGRRVPVLYAAEKRESLRYKSERDSRGSGDGGQTDACLLSEQPDHGCGA